MKVFRFSTLFKVKLAEISDKLIRQNMRYYFHGILNSGLFVWMVKKFSWRKSDE